MVRAAAGETDETGKQRRVAETIALSSTLADDPLYLNHHILLSGATSLVNDR